MGLRIPVQASTRNTFGPYHNPRPSPSGRFPGMATICEKMGHWPSVPAEATGQSPTSSGYSNNLGSWRRAIATPNIRVGHGNRSLRRLAVSGLGRVAAARPPRVGAQESANQEHGSCFLWELIATGGKDAPHSCPRPRHPSPPASSEGARDDGAEGKGERGENSDRSPVMQFEPRTTLGQGSANGGSGRFDSLPSGLVRVRHLLAPPS
jgi:hypothetical protein